MTRERRRINELKEEIAELKKQKETIERDRNLYRDAFITKLKWFLKLLGEKSSPCLKWTIEDMSKTLNKAQHYYW